jgi:antitoxin YefM
MPNTTVIETLSMVEAREQLTRLPEQFERTGTGKEEVRVIKVTRRNKPVLAILPWELYEALLETVEILGDDEQMAALREALKEVAQGQGKSWETVKVELGWDESGPSQATANSGR